MTVQLLQSRWFGVLMAGAALLGGPVVFAPSAIAQNLLQEQGTIRPAQNEYSFSGTEGQMVTISMTSSEFDTVLELLGPNDQQVAFNDDYGRTLNSRIIVTLPTTGEYKVLARSYSGQGGTYSIVVRPTTEYEMAYNRGFEAYMQGDYEGAIAAYTEAIALDSSQPMAYADRAEARMGQFYNSLGPDYNYEAPLEMDQALKDALIEDYEQAADLYEQAGDMDVARGLRDQVVYLRTGEYPAYEEAYPIEEDGMPTATPQG